jgi:hypothetical protein
MTPEQIAHLTEFAARQKKAALLVGALSSVGIPAHNARLMSTEEWASVAKCAGVRVPSDETKQAVYQALEDMAAPKHLTVREWQKHAAEADVWSKF